MSVPDPECRYCDPPLDGYSRPIFRKPTVRPFIEQELAEMKTQKAPALSAKQLQVRLNKVRTLGLAHRRRNVAGCAGPRSTALDVELRRASAHPVE